MHQSESPWRFQQTYGECKVEKPYGSMQNHMTEIDHCDMGLAKPILGAYALCFEVEFEGPRMRVTPSKVHCRDFSCILLILMIFKSLLHPYAPLLGT